MNGNWIAVILVVAAALIIGVIVLIVGRVLRENECNSWFLDLQHRMESNDDDIRDEAAQEWHDAIHDTNVDHSPGRSPDQYAEDLQKLSKDRNRPK